MPDPLELRFVTSADSVARLPATSAEVTVVGRSNVGKSSLINALAGRRGLARVSKTPGRTQLLNCYALPGDSTLVDCPGYGYASVSKGARQGWQRMIERYLLERDQLRMVMVLVDAEIGPTALDVQMLDWLRANPVAHSVIATKYDKVKSAQRARRMRELALACSLQPSDVLWTSADTGTGIDQLRDRIRLWLS